MLKVTLRITALVCAVLFVASAASAAPVALTLVSTTILYNEDPPGAPLPLGRTQYDAGNVLNANNVKVGEYLRVKDVHAGGLNVAAVTLTLFIPRTGSSLPVPITLQGAHTFNTGDEAGSISASSIPGIVGVTFTVAGATDILTLNFP